MRRREGYGRLPRSWGEGTRVPSFPLPKPLSLLPSFLLLCSGEMPQRQLLTEYRLRGEAPMYFPAAACAKCLTTDTAAVAGEMPVKRLSAVGPDSRL